MSPRTLGLIANSSKDLAGELVRSLATAFQSRGIDLLPDGPTGEMSGMPAVSQRELVERSELIVILGGDGTILEAKRNLGPVAPPFFGINIGSLGFLTSVGSAAWPEAVECIAAG